ncbi:OmpA family protein [Kalamiella sp. sgz302252]|uniref:OmpA family protein n=1 Tax=Pantoea sp. sgz302252 TaxID=3341827 RepID=UPI0036D281CB
MRDYYRSLLTVLAVALSLLLILGFWPLATKSQLALSLAVMLIGGLLLWRQRRRLQAYSYAVREIKDDNLPPEEFQGAVILVCGDSSALFSEGKLHRETRQGWYLLVKEAEQLPSLAQHLFQSRPALAAQLSVLLAILPETHLFEDSFIQSLRGWQRALAQTRTLLGRTLPLWTATWVSPPAVCADEEPVWFTQPNQQSEMQVYQPGQGNLALSEWVKESGIASRLNRLSLALWLTSLLDWQQKAVNSLLTERSRKAMVPCAQGICITPTNGEPDNLWHQHIIAITALAPKGHEKAGPLPLPEPLTASLPRRRGISRSMVFWRRVGIQGGIFLALAMLASFINNQRLIRNIGDHLTLYHHLSGEPVQPKIRAQQRLRADSALLDGWQQRGEPLRYRLGLYQGLRLIPPLEAAINGWAPPAPPPPVIKKIVQGPQTIRLDSMSLFDSGKYQLKAGSTKLLVNSLVGIKAKPGWLIVVAGHTDNTGSAKLNQLLSLQRAEAVRDWMRETGDVPASCFAVQGYGASRPIANNDTAEGRTLNRRVEISLVPQANACALPGDLPASSQDDGADNNLME